LPYWAAKERLDPETSTNQRDENRGQQSGFVPRASRGPALRSSLATPDPPSAGRRRKAPAAIAPVPRIALNLDEAAAAIGVSRDFFDEHVAHELRIVRRGRKRLVPAAELERWALEGAARTLG